MFTVWRKKGSDAQGTLTSHEVVTKPILLLASSYESKYMIRDEEANVITGSSSASLLALKVGVPQHENIWRCPFFLEFF